MGIFSRMSDIVNANINSILEKAEDPEKLVRLMIQEMEDTLVEVRSTAARAIADKKELHRRLAGLEREASDWDGRAELAVSKGRDDLAKAALMEKRKVESTAEVVRGQLTHVKEALSQLSDDIGRLQEKLADAKARREAMVIRHRAASKRLMVREREHHVDDALIRFEQFERKMEQLEGRVESYDLGKKRDLRHEIQDLEEDEKVERALGELKERMRSKSPS
ncbi:MAG: phage shock protein PspA [Proteobacteria bacterium]|nr:phage shock protein PspA [Pseudomonadota bacterium]